MASANYISLMAGLAAFGALGLALPAHANLSESQAPESQALDDSWVPTLSTLEGTPNLLAGNSLEAVDSTAAATLLQPVNQDDDLGFSSLDGSHLDLALGYGTLDTSALSDTAPELAQVTPVTPGPLPSAYVGVGGNLGFVSNESAVGDWGFAVLSKFDLGTPRFSLRPSLLVSESNTSVTVPVTFNFNQYQVAGFRFQPFAGVGADIGDSTSLLLNAGADIPLNQLFTLNTTANFRVTSGFGFGLTVGVGYTIPWFID